MLRAEPPHALPDLIALGEGTPTRTLACALTRVLVGLYEEPEKPGNAIEFIKKCLGAPSDTDVEQLKADNEELRRNKAVTEPI